MTRLPIPLAALLSLSLGAAASADASAPGATSETEGTPASEAPAFDCAAERWILDGAGSRSDRGGGASYNPEWAPTIEGVAGCFLTHASLEDACLGIRGHSDELAFDQKVAGAFGSIEAAHLARARGRALEVLSRLYQQGVPAERLRDIPPALDTGVRGVELVVIPRCIARAPAPAKAEAAPVDLENVRTLVRESLQESHAEAEAARMAELESRGPDWHFFVDAGLHASVLGFRPGTTFGPTVQPSLGARFRQVFARADLGLAMGMTDVQRLGVELGGAAGYFHVPELQLAIVAATRFAGPGVRSPWLEQSWSLGVEGTHCLWSWGENEVCLTESVRPLGERTTRGELVDGQLFQIQPRTENTFRFDVGVKARFGL